jgi:hypothetical protein
VQHPLWNRAEAIEVSGLAELVGVLHAADKNTYVVYGEPTPDVNLAHVRRLKSHFVEVQRRYLILDVDRFETPIEEPAECARIVRDELLPEVFHGAQCGYQATAGHQLKEGHARLRLIFWLDAPLYPRQMAAWTQSWKAVTDPSIYRANQPIYIAPPTFEGGPDFIESRWPRWGVLEGCETVAVPENLHALQAAREDRPQQASADVQFNAPHMVGEWLRLLYQRLPSVVAKGRRNAIRFSAADARDHAISEDIVTAVIHFWFSGDGEALEGVKLTFEEYGLADLFHSECARLQAFVSRAQQDDAWAGADEISGAIAKQIHDGLNGSSPLGCKYVATERELSARAKQAETARQERLSADFSAVDGEDDDRGDIRELRPIRLTSDPFASGWTLGTLMSRGPYVPEWLIPGFLPLNVSGIIYGLPGSLKTTVVHQAGFCVAAQTPWLDGSMLPYGGFLSVAMESADHTTNIVLGMLAANPEVKERCDRVPLYVHPHPLPLYDKSGRATQNEKQLIGMAKAFPERFGVDCKLIVLDTLARALVPAQENMPSDVAILSAAIERIRAATGATVLLTHHPTKDGGAMRGTGALTGNFEGVIRAERDRDKARSNNGRLIVERLKGVRDGAVLQYRSREVRIGEYETGAPLVTFVLESADSSADFAQVPAQAQEKVTRPDKLSKRQRRLLGLAEGFGRPFSAVEIHLEYSKRFGKEEGGISKDTIARELGKMLGIRLAREGAGRAARWRLEEPTSIAYQPIEDDHPLH